MHQQRNARYGAIVAVLALGALACNDPTNATHTLASQAASLAAEKGGSSPSSVVPPIGTAFDLSINSVPQGQTVTMTGTDGHTIFVQLFGGDSASSLKGGEKNSINEQDRIFLQPAPTGQTYQVLRVNGMDVNGASIQLPVGARGQYDVWVQAMVPPTGTPISPNCTTVSTGVACFLGTVNIPKSPNANIQNRSSDLLAIALDVSANPTLSSCLGVSGHQQVTAGLFSSCFQGIFWTPQANGVAVAQLQFYPKS